MAQHQANPLQVVQPTGGKGPGVLVVHSWWGLTPSFTRYAQQLSRAGFIVALPDLFNGEIATSEQQARQLRAKPRRQPFYKTLIAAIEELQATSGVRGSSIGIVGFSMGGHWAVWLSQRPNIPIAATIIYYAARAGDFSGSRSSYLAHFASDDPWVSGLARRRMEQAIAKAQRPYQAFDYAQTGHWFAESDRRQDYNRSAADLALHRSIATLKATLT
jgi:carboxymethylenebutenolidase